ncbi:MAG: RNA polymerase sigma-54 factor [Pirellulaceae bacterium]|jgi:RNA polymerase sigma-54 factor
MIQSMEILQLPIMALQERIEQELIENPILEKQEVDPNSPDQAEERDNPDAPTDSEREMVVDENNSTDDFERLLNLDQDVPDYFDESPRRSANRMQEEGDRKHDAMANVVSRPQSLHDYLLDQIGELEIDPEVEQLCQRIISTLDPADGGYFRSSVEDLLPNDADAEKQALAHRALGIVQALDPTGIAARDLRECLLTQLIPTAPYYEEIKTLITGHLEDLRDNRLPQIQRITGYTIERIQEAWEQLRKLNPKPAGEFAESFVPTVTPDLFLDRAEDGSYKVRLEDTETPTLFISDYYRRRLMSGDCSPEEREFIKRKVNAAQWLIDSIEQRRSTLSRVAQAIVDHQTKFLDEGPEYIEPLKMQQIADLVGVHVTTVSRAVDDKWMQTQRGILPLKRFFVGGTQSRDGEDVAWDKIRIKLKEIIDHEDKQKPYSDDELVNQLQAHGFPIKRRTVTKYRKKMGIASSRQRKNWSE